MKMRLVATAVALFLLSGITPGDARAQGIGWTISASSTDPFVNTGTPGGPGTLTQLYLWYACNTTPPSGPGVGISAMECAMSESPIAAPTMNGFSLLNPVSLPDILLVVGGCPAPPVSSAVLLYVNDGLGLEVHLEPSLANGLNLTVDCGGNTWPNQFIGYSEVGPPVQNFVGEMCGFGTVSVEEQSWGRMKGLYR
jgi:hypothetical protein